MNVRPKRFYFDLINRSFMVNLSILWLIDDQKIESEYFPFSVKYDFLKYFI